MCRQVDADSEKCFCCGFERIASAVKTIQLKTFKPPSAQLISKLQQRLVNINTNCSDHLVVSFLSLSVV